MSSQKKPSAVAAQVAESSRVQFGEDPRQSLTAVVQKPFLREAQHLPTLISITRRDGEITEHLIAVRITANPNQPKFRLDHVYLLVDLIDYTDLTGERAAAFITRAHRPGRPFVIRDARETLRDAVDSIREGYRKAAKEGDVGSAVDLEWWDAESAGFPVD